MVRLMVLILWGAAACGNIANPGQRDTGFHDAEVDTPVQPAPPLREARELVTGGTRMTGTTYTFDIQLGHAMQQSKASGATYQLEGNEAVKP